MVLLGENKFVGNQFKTREDFEAAAKALLDPLAPHTSPGGALITLGSSGTHYDLRAAQLEAFARPLWGLTSLLAGGGKYDKAKTWSQGLANGTDPDGEEFWGWTKGKDQRMVEMSPIGFGIALAAKELVEPLTDKQKENIGNWLGAINDKPMPDTNWLWFRVFANLALRSLSSPKFNSQRLKADLDHLDTFQLRGEESGWSRDGPEGVMQIDYYSGSFAIVFAMLVYSRLCNDTDPERAAAYRKRVLKYVLEFIYYFDAEGRCIPFGRSMIYRFAVISTFAVLPFAFPSTSPDLSLPGDYPLKWGHIRGLVGRHMRYWGGIKDILRSDGTVNIGYGYENMNMTENYNGFGSPYWCMKAFACLAVPSSHPFWSSEELPYPTLPVIKPLVDPSHIMIRVPPSSPNLATHTYLLSSGQSAHYPLKHAEAKYAKFSYSSAFGFSCPTGSFGLEQLAADSMLALCDDPEEEGFGEGERWRIRREPHDYKIEKFGDSEGEVWLKSGWQPWPDVEVDTWLIPPTKEAPCWYLRIHRLTTKRDLRSSEAGWAIYGQGKDGRAIVQVFSGERTEGGLEETGIVRAATQGGVSGVADLSSNPTRKGKLIQSDPNSNLINPRSILPSLLGRHTGNGKEEWLVTAVFGLPNKLGEDDVHPDWSSEWEKRPVLPDAIKKLIA